MTQDRGQGYSFNSGKLCKLNSQFGIIGEHMAGKDFKVLQILEARVCVKFALPNNYHRVLI